jgi:hypothetical protein
MDYFVMPLFAQRGIMLMTRSARDVEIKQRCCRAVNLFTNVTLVGAQYWYTVGMLNPLELDLFVWLVSFIAIASSQQAMRGPWVEREKEAILDLINHDWMESYRVHVPPVLRAMLFLIRKGEHWNCNLRLLQACEERTTDPTFVLLHLGYWVCAGPSSFHMIGRGRVIEQPELVSSDPEGPPILVYGEIANTSASSVESDTGTVYDANGNQI